MNRQPCRAIRHLKMEKKVHARITVGLKGFQCHKTAIVFALHINLPANLAKLFRKMHEKLMDVILLSRLAGSGSLRA